MTIKHIKFSIAKGRKLILNILEQVEKTPSYWIGLFTSFVLLIASVSVKNSIPEINILYFGGENGAVGAALAQGRGFSDPFLTGSGATAWVPPLLPAILGIIFYITNFKITAIYWIALFIKIFTLGFGSGLIWDVLQKSNRGFAPVCYLWMGILCYLNRDLLVYNFHDEWLIFFVISLAFWAWHKRTEFSGRIILMIAFAMAALCSPILWIALFMVMLIFNRKVFKHNNYSEDPLNKQRTFFARNSFWIAVGVSFVLIAGWTMRNWIQLEMFAPVKSNAGYEIFQAQLASRNGVLSTSTFIYHPHNVASKENKAYAELGETAFISARRDMTLRSIVNDPIDYLGRVGQRFSNAFLYTVSHFNFDDVDSRISNDDLKKLRSAGLIEYFFNRKVWINLDDPDKDVIKTLPLLNLNHYRLVEYNYKQTAARYDHYLYSWNRIIGGLLMGGMPWIALLIAILMRRHSERSSYILWVGLFLLIYLTPYVLISHYLRYQVPLLGMQAILLTSGTIAILRNTK
jgi:hypothetical protein